MPLLGWDFFDKVYCITLDSRPDRREQANRQFVAVGLSDRVEFFIVARDSENPERGIYQSHLRCLAQGLETGARHILVFEDDVVFRNFNAERLHAACCFLQESRTWNAFFLGCITTGSRNIGNGNGAVVQVRYRCLSHAYALNRPFAEQIIREPWRGLPFDGLLQRCNEHFFALQPMCAFQGLASSDNATVWIDTLRNLCGGLVVIQRGNELYQNNKKLVIALHLLVAVGTIAFFTLARQ